MSLITPEQYAFLSNMFNANKLSAVGSGSATVPTQAPDSTKTVKAPRKRKPNHASESTPVKEALTEIKAKRKYTRRIKPELVEEPSKEEKFGKARKIREKGRK